MFTGGLRLPASACQPAGARAWIVRLVGEGHAAHRDRGVGPGGLLHGRSGGQEMGRGRPHRCVRQTPRTLRTDPHRGRPRPPVDQGRCAALREDCDRRDGAFRRQCRGGRRHHHCRTGRALRCGGAGHRRAGRPRAADCRGRSGQRYRQRGFRRLVQWPSRIRRARSAAIGQACSRDWHGQCRARCRADPGQDRKRVRRVGYRHPCARHPAHQQYRDDHHPRAPRPAPDHDDAQGAGRTPASRARPPAGR